MYKYQAKFAAKNWRTFALCSSSSSTEISQQTSPCTAAPNQKNHQAAKLSPPNMFIKSSWHNLGYQFVVVSVLMQRISGRLTSRIAGLGGNSKDHDF